MDKADREKLREGFEAQLRHIFYKKPEFPFLPSMGCFHVFFPVRNEEHNFGFLILEWECHSSRMWNWIGTWVDTEEELSNYKYKREGIESIVDMPKLVGIFAEHMAQVHHREMMRKRESENEDWREWSELQKSTPKPYLN